MGSDMDNEEAIKSLYIKEAIEIIADAWNNVKPATIKNCWQHTKNLPETTSEMDIDEIDEDIANLISTLNCLILADPSVDMTAEEYVELDRDLITANLSTVE